VPIVYTTFEPDRALDVSQAEAESLGKQGLLVPAPIPVPAAASVKAAPKSDAKVSE